jgi:hypothetical protein
VASGRRNTLSPSRLACTASSSSDSYTLGVGVEFDDIFSKRLERRLNGRGPYEVINFGVNGYNTAQELATFREVAAAFHPDLVIVAYVLNDADPEIRFGGPPAARESRSLLDSAHVFVKDRSVFYRYLAPRVGSVLSALGGRYAIGRTREIMG